MLLWPGAFGRRLLPSPCALPRAFARFYSRAFSSIPAFHVSYIAQRVALPLYTVDALTGDSAVAILTAVIDAVDTAVANNDNLCALRDRAVDLLEVIAESCVELQASGAYARIVSALTDALREICDYARAYGQRSVIAKLLFGSGHRERFEDLSGQLAELTRDATFAISTKTAAKVAGMVGRLQAATAYVVRSADRRH